MALTVLELDRRHWDVTFEMSRSTHKQLRNMTLVYEEDTNDPIHYTPNEPTGERVDHGDADGGPPLGNHSNAALGRRCDTPSTRLELALKRQ